MAKEAYYFSHDYGARNDPKMQKVLMKLGQEGKGVYWDLVEMLFEEGGKLNLDECESYAFALHTDIKVINSLISDFDLFKKDDLCFWSNSVLRRLQIREEKSLKASQSAQKRWKNKVFDANALQSDCEGNAIKESKIKEIKEIKEIEEVVEVENFYGEYSNVYLTKNNYSKLLSMTMNQELLNELITNLDENIGCGKEKPYEENLKDAHFIRLKAYLKHRRQNPTVKTGEYDAYA